MSLSLMLLALVLSLDSFTVGLLYGARGIRLPRSAKSIVSLATGLFLAVSMWGGRSAANLLPVSSAQRAGALLLVAVGIWITYQTWRTQGQRLKEEGCAAEPRERRSDRIWRVRFGPVGIVIEILREPGAADLDRSGHITPAEAWFLGVALAMDSLAAGFGAAMAGYSPISLPLVAAAASYLLMTVGSRMTQLVPLTLKGRWSMVHGLVLVALGLYRMVV